MTRKQREEQLNKLLETEAGLNEIVALFHQKVPDVAPSEPDPPQGMMVQLILDQEFPPALPGGHKTEVISVQN